VYNNYVPNIPDPEQYNAPGYRVPNRGPIEAPDVWLDCPVPPARWDNHIRDQRAKQRLLALLVRVNGPIGLKSWVDEADDEPTVEITWEAKDLDTEDLDVDYCVEGEDDWF
jgi:hypothetical protein